MFKKGTPQRICREIEEADLGEVYYLGRRGGKNPVKLILILNGDNEQIGNSLERIARIVKEREIYLQLIFYRMEDGYAFKFRFKRNF